MSIRIDFQPSKPSRPAEVDLDLASASESQLRYEAFTGDVAFEIEGLDLSARWGWIPGLDFAAALVHVVEDLEGGAPEAALDFTESEDEIRFSRRPDGNVEVRSTYTDGSAEVALSELRSASVAFAQSMLRSLCERWPALEHNSDLRRWYPSTT